MGKKIKLKDISKIDLVKTIATDSYPNDDVKASALMRIADATELIANNYSDLLQQIENHKQKSERHYEWYKTEKAAKERLERRINSYKGTVTRLQNRIKQLEKPESE